MGQGLDPETARRSARVTFGNVTRAREDYRERRRLTSIDHLGQDLKGALRGIRRYPIAALVAVLSLGAGIGATTITLTVRNILFKKAPFGYRDPDQLSRVQIGRPTARSSRSAALSPRRCTRAGRRRSIRTSAARARRRCAKCAPAPASRRSPLRAVTPNLFGMLGVEPMIGQPLPADANSASALLSYRVWQHPLRRTAGCRRPRLLDRQPAVHSDRRHARALLVRRR